MNPPPFEVTLLYKVDSLPNITSQLSGCCFHGGFLYTVNRAKNVTQISKFSVADNGVPRFVEKHSLKEVRDPEGIAFENDTMYVSNENNSLKLASVKLNGAGTAAVIKAYPLNDVNPSEQNMGAEGVCVSGGRMFVGVQQSKTSGRTLYVRNGADFNSWKLLDVDVGKVKDMTSMGDGLIGVLHSNNQAASVQGVRVVGDSASVLWEADLGVHKMKDGINEGLAYDPERQLLVLCGEPNYMAVYKVKWDSNPIFSGLQSRMMGTTTTDATEAAAAEAARVAQAAAAGAAGAAGAAATAAATASPATRLANGLEAAGVKCLVIQLENALIKDGNRLNPGYLELISEFQAIDDGFRVYVSSNVRPATVAAVAAVQNAVPDACYFIGGVGEGFAFTDRANTGGTQQTTYLTRAGLSSNYAGSDKGFHINYIRAHMGLSSFGEILLIDNIDNMRVFRSEAGYRVDDFKISTANAKSGGVDFSGLLMCRNRDRAGGSRPNGNDLLQILASLQRQIFGVVEEDAARGLERRRVALSPTNPNPALMKPVPAKSTARTPAECRQALSNSVEYNAATYNPAYAVDNCFFYDLGSCSGDDAGRMLCTVPQARNGERGCDKATCEYDRVEAIGDAAGGNNVRESWFKDGADGDRPATWPGMG
jgi:hypothetical protein